VNIIVGLVGAVRDGQPVPLREKPVDVDDQVRRSRRKQTDRATRADLRDHTIRDRLTSVVVQVGCLRKSRATRIRRDKPRAGRTSHRNVQHHRRRSRRNPTATDNRQLGDRTSTTPTDLPKIAVNSGPLTNTRFQQAIDLSGRSGSSLLGGVATATSWSVIVCPFGRALQLSVSGQTSSTVFLTVPASEWWTSACVGDCARFGPFSLRWCCASLVGAGQTPVL